MKEALAKDENNEQLIKLKQDLEDIIELTLASQNLTSNENTKVSLLTDNALTYNSEEDIKNQNDNVSMDKNYSNTKHSPLYGHHVEEIGSPEKYVNNVTGRLTDWKVGDVCSAPWPHQDTLQFYDAQIQKIIYDHKKLMSDVIPTVHMKFLGTGEETIVPMSVLRGKAVSSMTVTSHQLKEAAAGGNKRKEMDRAVREKKQAKKRKQQQARDKEIEESHQQQSCRQQEWMKFNKKSTKVLRKSVINDKSIFKTNDRGKVGVVGSGAGVSIYIRIY